MPRKAGGTSAKANAKGGAAQASAAITADVGGHILDSTQVAAVVGPNATVPRGGSANRGVKRRRASNNVNSSSGTEMYGSGTIVASNPFDDDNHMPLSAANHNIGPPRNKMMMMTGPQHPDQHSMHTHMHQAHHLSPAQHHQPQHHHQMPQHHHPQQHHQHQQTMHPHHQQQPMYPHRNQNNHHYQQAMQQPMPMAPGQAPLHAQMGTPPGHVAGALPPPPPQHQQHQQQGMMPPMHNHGPHMMPPQSYGHPPPHPHAQHMGHHQVHHPQAPPHQPYPQQQPSPQHLHQQQMPPQQPQANHMMGTSTPPHMMGAPQGPNTTHSPYNTMQQAPVMSQLHPAMAPQGPPAPQTQPQVPPPPSSFQQHPHQQQPQQHQQLQPPPPSHHHHHQQQADPMVIQETPSIASNQLAYRCGKCQRDVYKQEQHIVCKAGCKSYFHISCSGLTQLACELLMKEALAEWACDRCTRRVPYVKYIKT